MKIRLKRIVLVLAISLLFSNVSIVESNSALKKGQTCGKSGETRKQGSEVYICTKLDGKLKWQYSVAQNQQNIWKDLQKKRSSLPDVTTSLQVLYSPTVNKKSAEILLKNLNQAAKLWQLHYLPNEPLPTLFFTEKDRAWFISTMQKLGVYSENQLSNFDNEVARNGNRGNWAGITGDGGRLWMTYMIGTGRNTFEPNDSQVAAHEYTHLAQNAIAPQQVLTCWQVEGGAAFYGLYLGANSLKELKEFIKVRNSEKYFLGFEGLTKQPIKDWTTLIDKFGPNYDSRQCGPNGAYPVGAVMHEYLYSLKGHQGIIDMLINSASEGDFILGMEETYEKSWNTLRKEIAEYIKIQVAQSN
jgi:hypothetical protein